jgi:hypothetical protein
MPERKVEYFKNPATFWLPAGIYSLEPIVLEKKSWKYGDFSTFFPTKILCKCGRGPLFIFGHQVTKFRPKKKGDSVAHATNICIKKGEEYFWRLA